MMHDQQYIKFVPLSVTLNVYSINRSIFLAAGKVASERHCEEARTKSKLRHLDDSWRATSDLNRQLHAGIWGIL
jgi:hypothetical protein